MMSALFIAGALSILVGVILGMLGGGGAILTLPLLVYAVGVEPKAAIAMSLFVVGSASLAGTLAHARAKNVRFRLGAIFGAAAMAGAFAGGHLAKLIPAAVLLVVFASVMLLTAIAMLRGRSERVESRPLPLPLVLGLGAAVGLLSGLVGAGGGFLIVPALTLVGGLALRQAMGTSLFIIALQSFAGFAGHVTHVELDWKLLAVVTGCALVGTLGGALLGERVRTGALRVGFAWLVLAMGLFVIGKQLSLPVTALIATIALLAALFATRGKRRLENEKSCTI